MSRLYIEHILSNVSPSVDFESPHSVNALRVCGLWSFDGLQPSIDVMIADSVRGELADDFLFVLQ